MHALAAKRGGKFLSTEVKGAHDKYFWGCELGHTFSATRASVDIQGSWCPVCRKAARGTLARMRRIARKRKGECLSKEYVSSTHKLHFRCEERHEFWMTPAAVLNHWCPECGLGIGRSRPTLTLEDLEETAIERGGKCLSDEYRGVRAYYEWECASHHRWEATGQVVRSGHWCHRCAHRIVGTIEGMRAYAVGLGGECLSAEYTGQRTMLQFRCRARHRFELMGAAVKTGVWCPRCARDAGRDGAMKPDVRGTKTKRLDATG
jgi:hypothetical protein